LLMTPASRSLPLGLCPRFSVLNSGATLPEIKRLEPRGDSGNYEPEILTWARILYYLGVTELLSGRRLVSPPTVRYLSFVPVR
jgi:hypothetical protein